ncbi:putative RNA-directed DNA polymerase from transposon BS, partial [Araneus ventricosus]
MYDEKRVWPLFFTTLEHPTDEPSYGSHVAGPG